MPIEAIIGFGIIAVIALVIVLAKRPQKTYTPPSYPTTPPPPLEPPSWTPESGREPTEEEAREYAEWMQKRYGG